MKYELAANDDAENLLTSIVQQDSDLLPKVYEGGLKTWECALDLSNYLLTNINDFQGLTVLELGCGTGLPGISLMPACQVDFQDFNEQVLRIVTVPNVIANGMESRPEDGDTVQIDPTIQSSFFAGDWRDLKHIITKKYDMVITCETIYDAGSIPALLELIQHCLVDGGVALVAAKSFYFGCSGSLLSFLDLVRKNIPGCLIETVHVHSETVRREICRVKLRFTAPNSR